MDDKNKKDIQRPLDYMSGKSREGSEFSEPAEEVEYTRPDDRITPFQPNRDK